MNKQIENIKKVRLFLLGLIQDLSEEQLNKVPAGFNNNIIWNLAHLIAAQQGICYIRSGLQPVVDAKYLTAYKSGTKPQHPVDNKDIAVIKEVLLSSLDQLEKDCQNKVFQNYNAWTTRYGVELANIEDAIGFLTYHEGLHVGYIMALKRVVNQ